MKWLLQNLGVTMGSLTFSGDALARIAVDPDFAGATGQYLQSKNGSLITSRSSKASYDEEKAFRLWRDSATLVKLESNETAEVLR
jgi:hypothetical protein